MAKSKDKKDGKDGTKKAERKKGFTLEIDGIIAKIAQTTRELEIICLGDCPLLTGCKRPFCPIYRLLR